MKAIRFIFVVAFAAIGVAVVSCGPKSATQPGAAATGAGALDACRDITMRETAVARDSNDLALLRTEVATREAELVELQRLKSRIVTGRITDDELAAWGRDTTRVEETAADTTDSTAVPVSAAPGDSGAAVATPVQGDTTVAAVSDSGEIVTRTDSGTADAAAPATEETEVAPATSETATPPATDEATIAPATDESAGTTTEPPVTGDQAPAGETESTASPTTGDQTPATGEQAPATGDQAPGDGTDNNAAPEAPAEGGESPTNQ